MKNRRGDPPRLRIAAIGPGLVALAVGGVMLWLALHMAGAGFANVAGDSALKQVRQAESLRMATLNQLAHSRERAIAWRETGASLADIALARMMLAEHGAPERTGENLALAESAVAKSLGMSPMNPYAWMRLVQLRLLRDAPAADTTPALRLALATGPHEDRRNALLFLTVEAGLSGWNELDTRERHLIADKAREAWRRDPAAAAQLAVRIGATEHFARLLRFEG